MTILKLLWKYRIYVLCGICLILGTIMVGMTDYTKTVKERMKTAENNFRIVQTENDTFRTKLNRFASEAEALQLSISQMKKLREKDIQTIKDLNIKLKDADFLINIGSKTEFKYIALVKDSIIRDTIYPCIDYTDNYFHIDGCIKEKKFYGNTYFIDFLSIVGSPVKSGWWIFKKTVGAKISVENPNPSSKIFFNEYIWFNN